ncbi:MAG TPA: threonine/serine exporter family protein [Intrasporangium sp.]|uniref:threonine/serine ThrE exporter family protein n=1 Tax=Intrasporangium sp. TaxID=1925024 RepID=UPI002D7A175A|nr:threonine/serine exporter family protein [Intrasporangium sp.]HET7399590.1 threonine/serine exporter family protein [Intrasporangium sp.]
MARSDRPSRPRSTRLAAPSLRTRTRRAMRPSGPPTDEIPLWRAPDGVERKTAQAVIDLAMRAGVAMLATGAAAADVNATVLLLTSAYGLQSVHVDVTYTSITVSYHRGPDADPMTVMRIVRYRVQDYTRLERLRELIFSLSDDPVDVEEARVRFDAVITAPHPYRRWLVTVASSALAAGVAGLLGAGPSIVVLSFLTAAVVSRVLDRLGKAGVAAFFAQCVGSAIPTAVATLVVVAQSHGAALLGDVSPSLVVESGIVLLLSGLSIVGAAEDALAGYYVTAGARAYQVVVLSLGIAIGITVVLAVGQRLGYPIAITSSAILSDNVVVQVVCAVIISVAFAVQSYASGRAVVVAGAAGGLGWVVLAVAERLDLGPASASAAAALVIGSTARLLARPARMSALAVTTAAIVPLLPGRAAYQGISQMVSQPAGLGLGVGLPTLAGAFGIGLGLAAGVSLGTYFGGLLAARWSGDRPVGGAGIPVRSGRQG